MTLMRRAVDGGRRSVGDDSDPSAFGTDRSVLQSESMVGDDSDPAIGPADGEEGDGMRNPAAGPVRPPTGGSLTPRGAGPGSGGSESFRLMPGAQRPG